ncbi:MAG: biopolymer transporter ExbD [Paracoccaceae bacterium]|nr:biopolymer transporter ExbD [Paracoccaceae bacterium]
MNLRRASVGLPPETITPLIDVVFFLLVFFLLVGRMQASAPFDVVLPEGQGQGPAVGALVLMVGADGSLARDGANVTRAEILGDVPKARVEIRAHADARLGDVLPLIASLEALGTASVALVVSGSAQ